MYVFLEIERIKDSLGGVLEHDSDSESMTEKRKEKKEESPWTWALGGGYR